MSNSPSTFVNMDLVSNLSIKDLENKIYATEYFCLSPNRQSIEAKDDWCNINEKDLKRI